MTRVRTSDRTGVLVNGVSLGRSRRLRAHGTEAERRLWFYLRNGRLLGAKFRRQYVIGPYIADFCCLDRRLIVELDGGQHSASVEMDRGRTAFLTRRGYRVLRFWNGDVLGNVEAVLAEVARALADTLHPHPGPLPEGEGKR